MASPVRGTPGAAPRRLLALADDLSGAAETAVALGLPGRIVLGPAPADGERVVVDLDTRKLAASDAARRVREALRGVAADTLLLKKADSLLRGNFAAETAAFTEGAGSVVAMALPALGRTVRGGVVHLDGVPLPATDAWRAEGAAAPGPMASLLPEGLVVPLEAVRGGELTAVLRDAVTAGHLPLCDAETDADLDLIASASLGMRLVGTGGLAAAVGRLLAPAGPPPPLRPRRRPLLVVVGTAEPTAAAQIAQLVARGAHHIAVPLDGPPRWDSTRDLTVLSIDATQGVRPGAAQQALDALTRLAAGHAGDADLVLTGGETARRVLDALGVPHLTPLGQIHHGAVRAEAPDGRHVVTRPGSFGAADSLLRIAEALHPAPPQGDPQVNATPTDDRSLPLIAVTMGDGAGIGPEVIVPALLDADTLARCRPVVIGDAGRLRQAAAILGADCDIVPVETPADAAFTPGRINVVDLALLPADLPWGALSPIAGEGAYQYVRTAARLALKGDVHGICTAPLNKEALHAAGHLYPGHTELLAHLTGVDEVSMMLSTPKVKVIHVTTHIGLIDAVNRIEPGLVERTVRRGHEAMVRAGVLNPVIGVCGINPHAGENGLFGYGEEEEKIVPALEVLRADGIDARGPLPADTAFFLAGRGDYDLIVAMYHDQGHGPVKVLGIESGVNLTVGLPVIRTSVDHGTAFDIAGKGVAEAGSMVEALRQAAEMSSVPAH
ncbi:4-hydroxythreonine-4-phosphate dehydrogenase PdxA [Streptomyces sp. ST1015]|uniref:4-hydroxythreonine-4-phosphate dehydrogenase PdxA n=1 Tax=unclassified Streptomyces TaxID=2593676 RepID=UPI00223B9A6F|nr:4-hydroxythreonine-4-phosphate dehydrogenase PdxA [Streptomyces sp. ST1015]QZZ24945.1 4-hydroxythreonine-4-phosphate dehydrogenase PdxA [Streptomyces sp. ST1015]